MKRTGHFCKGNSSEGKHVKVAILVPETFLNAVAMYEDQNRNRAYLLSEFSPLFDLRIF